MYAPDTEPADVPTTGIETLQVQADPRKLKNTQRAIDEALYDPDLRACYIYGFRMYRTYPVANAYVISTTKLKVDSPSTQELPKGTYFRLVEKREAPYTENKTNDPEDQAFLGNQMVFEALDPSDPTRRLRVTQWQGLASDTFDAVDNAMTVIALAATGL
jgi:hypothetical protein